MFENDILRKEGLQYCDCFELEYVSCTIYNIMYKSKMRKSNKQVSGFKLGQV